MKILPTITTVALLFAGCGGSPEAEGTGASAGSLGSGAASNGGSGGTSGGGTSGSAGGSSGNAGGSSGSGGGSNGGGSGGTGGGASGGTSGGSGGAGGGGSNSGLIATLCAQIDQLPCKVDNCIAELTEDLEDASVEGCGKEYAAVIECAIAHPLQCAAGNGGLQFDVACDPAIQAYQVCDHSECTLDGGSWGCATSCDQPVAFAASCTVIAGGNGLSCTCTAGPNSGAQFTLPGDCGAADWSDAVEAQCTS